MTILRPITIAAALCAALPALAHSTADSGSNALPGRVAATPHGTRTDKWDSQMKAMREMHEKMQRAQSAEERNALMAEHSSLMHDGMDMMGGMGGMRSGAMASPHPAAGPHMLERRMEMMQSMMQMMMDRMPPAPPLK